MALGLRQGRGSQQRSAAFELSASCAFSKAEAQSCTKWSPKVPCFLMVQASNSGGAGGGGGWQPAGPSPKSASAAAPCSNMALQALAQCLAPAGAASTRVALKVPSSLLRRRALPKLLPQQAKAKEGSVPHLCTRQLKRASQGHGGGGAQLALLPLSVISSMQRHGGGAALQPQTGSAKP